MKVAPLIQQHSPPFPRLGCCVRVSVLAQPASISKELHGELVLAGFLLWRSRCLICLCDLRRYIPLHLGSVGRWFFSHFQRDLNSEAATLFGGWICQEQ